MYQVTNYTSNCSHINKALNLNICFSLGEVGAKWDGGAKWDAYEQIQISQELLNIWQYNFISD